MRLHDSECATQGYMNVPKGRAQLTTTGSTPNSRVQEGRGRPPGGHATNNSFNAISFFKMESGFRFFNPTKEGFVRQSCAKCFHACAKRVLAGVVMKDVSRSIKSKGYDRIAGERSGRGERF